MNEQLTLDLNLPAQATFENYVSGPNIEIVTFLSQTFIERRESYVFLWGTTSVGKTHLFQACCHRIVQQGERAFFLDLKNFATVQPEILEGLEQYDLICLDNIHTIKSESAWQEALFYLYNRCRDQGTRLLVSATQAPAAIELTLADLKSRLSWGLILHIQELTDADKILALQLHAKLKGIKLADEVAQYILTHHSRDMATLMQLLEHIDKQSLIEKRRVTIPFLREIIA